jgi:tartrate dehydrogenase/decarboxylase/D-malate dehydrogenase
MMLEALGETDAATAVQGAMEQALAQPSTHTIDLGGEASTGQMADAIIAALAG